MSRSDGCSLAGNPVQQPPLTIATLTIAGMASAHPHHAQLRQDQTCQAPPQEAPKEPLTEDLSQIGTECLRTDQLKGLQTEDLHPPQTLQWIQQNLPGHRRLLSSLVDKRPLGSVLQMQNVRSMCVLTAKRLSSTMTTVVLANLSHQGIESLIVCDIFRQGNAFR